MTILIVFLACFLLLAVIRVPLAYSMLGAALACFLASGTSLGIVASTAYGAVDVFTYLAIPGFIFAGDLMLHGKIADYILDAVKLLFKQSKSVLGSFAVVLSMLFGTILGSATATVGLVGGMLIEKMETAGYRREESAALIAASGILGILIPPSVPGIMYAIVAGQSITKVWLSTVTSALLIGTIFIFINRRRCGKYLMDVPVDLNESEGNKKFELISLPALFAPVIIFGGIFGGIFTPTEAGAVIVIYSVIVGAFIYKGINRQNFLEDTIKAAKSTASIVLLIGTASVAGRLFTIAGVPSQLVSVITASQMSKTFFLIIMNLMLIIVGMFMETNTAILILTPLLLPVAISYGMDPIHFGAIILLNLQIGMLTPPFAANLFVATKVANVPFNKIVPPILVYIVAMLPVLAIVVFFPQFSMFLVNLLS